MNLTPFHSRASGFTLLEVLAAIALLAFAFAIGLRAMSGALSNATRGAALTTAVLQAQSLLDAQGLTAPLRAGLRHGSFVDGATWQLRASVYTPPSSPPAAGFAAPPAQSFGGGIDLYRLDLDVHYGGSGARALRFSTMRAQLMQGARQP
ncbi:MAG: prepilin-type N-terminal cleavage/methylation domain-containing protein [Rhodanobacteraceae bacterium]